jgi:hypothetical protein
MECHALEIKQFLSYKHGDDCLLYLTNRGKLHSFNKYSYVYGRTNSFTYDHTRIHHR